MVWKDFIVTASDGDALWSCRVSDGLSVHRDSYFIIAVEHSIEIVQGLSLRIV